MIGSLPKAAAGCLANLCETRIYSPQRKAKPSLDIVHPKDLLPVNRSKLNFRLGHYRRLCRHPFRAKRGIDK
jgi:hypothetical protein